MKNISKIIASCAALFASVCIAHSFNLSLDGGITLSRLANNQYIRINPDAPLLVNLYQNNNRLQTGSFVGYDVEYDFHRLSNKLFVFGMGLSVDHIDLSNLYGTETPYVNTLTDTLNYTAQSTDIAAFLEPKLIYTAHAVQPYVFAGIGPSWNTLHDFSESVPSGSDALPNAYPFANHTQIDFAYEFGAGMQYLAWKNDNHNAILLRLESRYINLGQSALGSAPGQTTADRLVSNISTVVVDCGVTYQFR